MSRDRIHLIAPAGSCRPFIERAGFQSADQLIHHIGDVFGEQYEVTGDAAIIGAGEDELRGGRSDDAARARDIENALADDRVTAIVGIRGGAWFTRVVRRIDFSVLDRRTRTVTVFGFSELTTLVNIVAAHPMGAGVYDMCPAFLPYGLKRFARVHESIDGRDELNEYVSKRLMDEFDRHLRDVGRMIEGRTSERPLTAERVRGSLSRQFDAICAGGNLVVFTALFGTPFERRVCPAGRWIVVEEINEKIERIDRFLAHLGLCGAWERCAGVLLGDFHMREANQGDAVIELLTHHLPADRDIPVLKTDLVGHGWPIAPLPVQTPRVMDSPDGTNYTIRAADPAD